MMFRGSLAALLAAAAVSSAVIAPAEAAQANVYQKCSITYTWDEYNFAQGTKKPVYDGTVSQQEASGIALVYAGVIKGFQTLINTGTYDQRRFAKSHIGHAQEIYRVNRACAGDEYYKNGGSIELATLSSNSKGESSLTEDNGSLSDGGIVIVVLSAFAGLGLLAAVANVFFPPR